MTYTLNYTYEEKSYLVIITKKRMKTITFRLINGSFKVSAPWYVSKKKILEYLDKFAPKMIKKDSIKNKQEDTNSIYFLGVKYDLNESRVIQLESGEHIIYKDIEDLKKSLSKIFLKIVTERVRYYESIMSAPSYKVAIGNTKSRYGSNSLRTKTLRFSTLIMPYSLAIIDSVVVHELAHCFYMDHSKNFYNVVYKYYPEYKKYHTLLKKGIHHE